ncbi:MAG: hypothetical protein Q9175_006382 [Cornicularia normoerica]
MTALRSRTNVTPKDRHAPSTTDNEPLNSTSKPRPYLPDPEEGPSHLSLLDVLRVLGGLFLLSSTLSYFITGNSILWGYRPAITRPARIKAWLTLNYRYTTAPMLLSPSLSLLMAPSTTSLPRRTSTGLAVATRSSQAGMRRGRL